VEARWLNRALRNLKEEADYIARDDPRAAARIVVEIESATALLGEQPALGRTGRVPGARELVVPGTPYLIPYRVRGGCVEVIRVFHGRRQLKLIDDGAR
jgi:toxin ParE1/3/4